LSLLDFLRRLHLLLHLLSIDLRSPSSSAVSPLRSDYLSPTLSFPVPWTSDTTNLRERQRAYLQPYRARRPLSPSPISTLEIRTPPRHEELRGPPTSEAEIDLVIDWRRTGVTLQSIAEQREQPCNTYIDTKGATSVRKLAEIDSQTQHGVASLGHR
jgi:hypothetical protein